MFRPFKNKKNILTSFLGKFLTLAICATLISPFISHQPSNAYFVLKKLNEEQSLNYKIQPGQTITDKLRLKNLRDYPITVEFYGVDGALTAEGNYTVGRRNTPQRTFGKWVKTQPSTITLQGGETHIGTFTIKIPETAPPGTYAGGFVLETSKFLKKEENADSTKSVESTGGKNNIRIALRSLIEVPGEKIVKLNINDYKKYSTLNGENFSFELENAGNTIINANATIDIEGFPAQEASINKNNITIFQSNSTPIDMNWGKNHLIGPLSPNPNSFLNFFNISTPLFGSYDGVLTVEYSVYNLATNTYSDPQTITKTISFTVIPWNLIIMIIVLISLIVTIYLTRKFRLRKLLSSCVKYTVQEGDTIITIAESHGVKWKLLAKINNLSPPYNLTPGTTIITPQNKKTKPKQ